MSFSAWSALIAAAALLAIVLLEPKPLPDSFLEGLTGDPGRGAMVLAAGGCARCHAAPTSALGASPGGLPVLAGGRRIESPFGTFAAPNISSGRRGLGTWSDLAIANAVLLGEGPEQTHLFPAMPYTAYRNMTRQDAADLIAHLRSLPSSTAANAPHDPSFPFNFRLGIGLWKIAYNTGEWALVVAPTPQIERGRYLVEALGHCGECHSPRDRLGGLDQSRWLGGAPALSGQGEIPNITPGGLDWSEAQIVTYLSTGAAPDLSVAGGEMAEVIAGLSQLPRSDIEAIAAYLKAVPPIN